MDDLPNLAIVMVTYRRTAEALTTIHSNAQNIIYPKEKRGWYIADDGSPKEHIDTLLGALEEENEKVIGWHNEKFSPGTTFAGQGWNLGLAKAHRFSEYVLWLEDDWRLERPLDITPYIRLLAERVDVGLIRLGYLAVGSAVHIVGHNGIHYLRYERNTQYAYSGNPSLRHLRFTEAYGYFAEDRSPGEIELAMDDSFRLASGPEIWRPVDLGGWGIYGHIGTDKTW